MQSAAPVPATATPNGFVFDEPTTGGSQRGNRAFAHFFGLNELVQSGTPMNYATGLQATDSHGFVAGSVMSLQVVGPTGGIATSKSVTIPAGTIGDMMNALNDPATGVGLYGGFSLDPQGVMKWTPGIGQGNLRMEIIQDVGPRGTTSHGFAAIFGVASKTREARALGIAVNPAIVSDPAKMGLARPDLSGVAVGTVAVGLADSRGAQALFDASRSSLSFSDGPGGVIRSMKLMDFVSTLGGDVGRLAAEAASDKETADGFKAEADARPVSSAAPAADPETETGGRAVAADRLALVGEELPLAGDGRPGRHPGAGEDLLAVQADQRRPGVRRLLRPRVGARRGPEKQARRRERPPSFPHRSPPFVPRRR
jgi:flagellar hook-associated protein 1 FlgK